MLAALAASLSHAQPSWVALGPEGGQVTALAIDPRSPDSMLVGADEGGVYHSANAGAAWTLRSAGLPGTVVRLAADPTVASRWWAASNVGLYRTDNDAQLWSRVDTGLMGTSNMLAFVVLDGPALYVASAVATVGMNAVVRRSTNQGAAWTDLTVPVMDSLTAFDARGAVLVAGSWSGVQVSNDTGATWVDRSMGLPTPLVDAVAFDPSSPDLLYVSTAMGLVRSTDRGMTYTAVAGGLPAMRLDGFGVAGTRLFAVKDTDCYVSTDRAMTWSRLAVGGTRTVTIVANVAARATQVVVGTRGAGVFRSIDNGTSWAAANTGLRATLISSIGVDRTAGRTILLGTRTSGTFRSEDRGAAWAATLADQDPLSAADALTLEGPVAWALVNTPAQARGAVLRSGDRGATWAPTTAGLPPGPYRSFASGGSQAFVGTCFGDVYRSDGQGGAWSATGAAGQTDGGLCFGALAVDPAMEMRVAASAGAGAPTDRVLISTNGGAAWAGALGGLPAQAIPGPVAFLPDGRVVLGVTGSGGGLFASSDQGMSWTALPGVVGEIRALAVDAVRGRLYVASTQALYESRDQGATFVPIDFGLPTVDVSALAIGSGPDLVYAGTRAAGLYAYRDPSIAEPDAGMSSDAGSSSDGGSTDGGITDDRVVGSCGCSTSSAWGMFAVLAAMAVARRRGNMTRHRS